MILIIGGAYQGKLDFAKEEFNIKEDEVLDVPKLCSMSFEKNDQDLNYAIDGFMDQNSGFAKCIYGLDAYIRHLTERGISSDNWIKKLIETLDSSGVVIISDVSQGLVPMEYEDRVFREANGRAMIMLAEHATEVYRVFCGIGTRIK